MRAKTSTCGPGSSSALPPARSTSARCAPTTRRSRPCSKRQSPLLARWRATAEPAVGEQLADAYERMLEVLKVHLRREVVEVIPVAEGVVTAEEWQAMGDHSVGAIPRSRLLPQLGMLLANSTPADRKEFFAAMPLSVKVLWRLVGKRQYAKQFRLLFPGRPVPPTI